MDANDKPWVLSELGYGDGLDARQRLEVQEKVDDELAEVTVDLWCSLDYKEGVSFYIHLDCDQDGTDTCRVTLVVRGSTGGDPWEDRHEFDDCFDLELFLPKNPVILTGLICEPDEFTFERLGRRLVYSAIAYSTNIASSWLKLLVQNPHEDDDLEEDAMEFVFGIWEGRTSTLTLPWSYAVKYFTADPK